MRQWLVALLGVCALLPAPAFAQEKRWTMKDLEALESGRYREEGSVPGESWRELVEHLEDIPPSERDNKWGALVERSTLKYLDALVAEKDWAGALAAAEKATGRYANLRKSRAFMEKRAEIGPKGYDLACFSKKSGTSDNCNEKLLAFVQADRDNRPLWLEATKVVIRHFNAYVAMPFARGAVEGNPAACGEEVVQRATLAALGLPKEDSKVKDAQVAAELCFDKLKDALTTAAAKEGGYTFDNSCALLVKKGAITGLMAKKCKLAP
jgi:hypothetical protein